MYEHHKCPQWTLYALGQQAKRVYVQLCPGEPISSHSRIVTFKVRAPSENPLESRPPHPALVAMPSFSGSLSPRLNLTPTGQMDDTYFYGNCMEPHNTAEILQQYGQNVQHAPEPVDSGPLNVHPRGLMDESLAKFPPSVVLDLILDLQVERNVVGPITAEQKEEVQILLYLIDAQADWTKLGPPITPEELSLARDLLLINQLTGRLCWELYGLQQVDIDAANKMLRLIKTQPEWRPGMPVTPEAVRAAKCVQDISEQLRELRRKHDTREAWNLFFIIKSKRQERDENIERNLTLEEVCEANQVLSTPGVIISTELPPLSTPLKLDYDYFYMGEAEQAIGFAPEDLNKTYWGRSVPREKKDQIHHCAELVVDIMSLLERKKQEERLLLAWKLLPIIRPSGTSEENGPYASFKEVSVACKLLSLIQVKRAEDGNVVAGAIRQEEVCQAMQLLSKSKDITLIEDDPTKKFEALVAALERRKVEKAERQRRERKGKFWEALCDRTRTSTRPDSQMQPEAFNMVAPAAMASSSAQDDASA